MKKITILFLLLINFDIAVAQINDQIAFKYIGINNKPVPTLFIKKDNKNLVNNFLIKSINVSDVTFKQLEMFVKKNKMASSLKANQNKEELIIQVSLIGKREIVYALLSKIKFDQYITMLKETLKNKKYTSPIEAESVLQSLNEIKIKLPY